MRVENSFDKSIQSDILLANEPQQFGLSKANPVIRNLPLDVVYQSESPKDAHYLARVYDLRALTNYTFQVQVSRFRHQLNLTDESNKLSANIVSSKPHRAPESARKLHLDRSDVDLLFNQVNESEMRQPYARIETKPFGAVATKCLANVSEVVVNTGRYFGGRISVEDSHEPKCNLLGNRSSEQSSYLFRIDHQLCGSKIVVS